MAKDVADVTTAMTFEEWFGAFIDGASMCAEAHAR
jgi:hypothetical protein